MVDFRQGKEYFKESITGKTRLVDRCVNILGHPSREWASVSVENPSVERVLFGSLCVLAIFPALGRMLGHDEFYSALLTAATIYIALIISITGAAWCVARIAGKLQSEAGFARVLQWMVFAWIPMFIGGCFKYIPYLGWMEIAGWIYGLYLLYIGSEVMLKTPEPKRFAIVAVSVFIWAVFNALAATAVGNVLHLFR